MFTPARRGSARRMAARQAARLGFFRRRVATDAEVLAGHHECGIILDDLGDPRGLPANLCQDGIMLRSVWGARRVQGTDDCQSSGATKQVQNAQVESHMIHFKSNLSHMFPLSNL